MLTKTIPSYLYTEYNDDADLQGFADAFNALAQQYVTLFSTIGLPVYSGLSGSLLDWVAAGLYGLQRPIVPTSAGRLVGPINTWAPNTLPINAHHHAQNGGYALASDDIFKRYMTWQLYKGDGRAFSVEWLKRRLQRFLTGANGTDPNVAATYGVSVRFGGGHEVQITIYSGFDPSVTAALAYLIQTRTVQLPFQFTFNTAW